MLSSNNAGRGARAPLQIPSGYKYGGSTLEFKQLLMRKSRCALLNERRHAFFLVDSGKQRVKEPPLE